MRRTSIYTLWFGGPVDLDRMCSQVAGAGHEVAGSGADPQPYVMFRAAGEAAAVALALLFPRTTLSTGQGTHTRTINLEGTDMSTKTTYDVILSDGTGAGTRARKDAAIKLGNMQDGHFTVVTSAGVTVYNSEDAGTTETPEAPAPAEQKEAPVAETKKSTKKAAAPAPAPEPEATEAEAPVLTLEFEGLGKYYARCAGLHGAERVGAVYGVTASIKGTTISLFGSEEDAEQVADQLQALWPAAKLAHKDYRKNDKVYSAISKDRKDKDANAERWDLEQAWFTAFMDGAADELAGSAKKKGGAYKDGVNAVRNPAPVDEGADVI